jgi:hypothetical protein
MLFSMSGIRKGDWFKGIALGLLVIAVAEFLDLGVWIPLLFIGLLPVFLVLRLVLWALEPIARKRGWGSEGRLTRYLSRPRFEDESRRTSQ